MSRDEQSLPPARESNSGLLGSRDEPSLPLLSPSRPSAPTLSVGMVTTAGTGGSLLVMLAQASGNELMIQVAAVIAPVLSSLAIGLWPHARMRIMIAYHQRTIKSLRKALKNSQLRPDRKRLIEDQLRIAEENLLRMLLPNLD